MLFSYNYSTKIEKEKREHAKQHGMIRTEITGAEIAEEMEKERRLFQLQMCEVSNHCSFVVFLILLPVKCSVSPGEKISLEGNSL